MTIPVSLFLVLLCILIFGWLWQCESSRSPEEGKPQKPPLKKQDSDEASEHSTETRNESKYPQ